MFYQELPKINIVKNDFWKIIFKLSDKRVYLYVICIGQGTTPKGRICVYVTFENSLNIQLF